MDLSTSFSQEWEEARTRFTNLLDQTTAQDLPKKLPPAPNSAGFLIRHIAEVELLFAKNVFGLPEVKIHAQTVIKKEDTGEWTELEPLREFAAYAHDKLREAIDSQSDDDWQATVTTKEFGAKTKAEALGRVVSHTTYHAGQLALILKYGQ